MRPSAPPGARREFLAGAGSRDVGNYVAGRACGEAGDPELQRIFALAGRKDANADALPM